ncbi:MAG: type IV secretory system conjugative DNA transfer family protein [Paracoccaceae bacterium]
MDSLLHYARFFRVLFIAIPYWSLVALGVSLLAYYAFEGGPLTWLLMATFGLLVMALAFGVTRLFGATASAYGKAAFAGSADLRQAELFKREPIIGRAKGWHLRFGKPGHLLTFAPTRSGKGVGAVIPNLLDHPGSVVVTDIKGENHAVTRVYRETLGRVIAFAPFDPTLSNDGYNPLDFIRTFTPNEVDDARMIAEMLVAPDGNEANHWEREARTLLTGLLLHVALERKPHERNLHRVRALLMRDRSGFEAVIEAMSASPHIVISTIGRGFSQKEDKERGAVISTAQSRMEPFDSPLLQAATNHSSFKMEDLKRETLSLFIIVPPEYVAVYQPVLRLMVGLATAAMTREAKRPKHPVLFLLDELPALGHMRPIEDGIGYLAGYGVTLWLFVQDLDQLQKTYVKWRSMIANCAVRQAFNVQDTQTAELLSDMLGQRTVRTRSGSRSGRFPWLWMATNFNETVAETGRPLLSPAEIMLLPESQMLVFVQGCKPILAEKVRYFADRHFRKRFDAATFDTDDGADQDASIATPQIQ